MLFCVSIPQVTCVGEGLIDGSTPVAHCTHSRTIALYLLGILCIVHIVYSRHISQPKVSATCTASADPILTEN